MTNCLIINDHIWGNICAFPRILGSPSSYMTLQLLHHFWVSLYTVWGKFDLLFYQCVWQINVVVTKIFIHQSKRAWFRRSREYLWPISVRWWESLAANGNESSLRKSCDSHLTNQVFRWCESLTTNESTLRKSCDSNLTNQCPGGENL